MKRIVLLLFLLVACSGELAVDEESEMVLEQRQTQEPEQVPENPNEPEENEQKETTPYKRPVRREPISIPTNLKLPFNIEDLRTHQILISPFGIIRHSKDIGHGHGGIDFPLVEGSQVYAVADGEVTEMVENADGRGGDKIVILISGGDGEGWGFLYEHMKMNKELALGDEVKEGDVVGYKQESRDMKIVHFQLTYLFNNYRYYRDSKCWIDYLEESDKREITEAFENTPELVSAWEDTKEEGYYPYKELFKDPKMCYEYGLDARVPV